MMDLQDIGMTQQELQERVVAAVVERLFRRERLDEDGEAYTDWTEFERRIELAAAAAIDAKVEELATEHIIPRINQLVDDAILVRTSRFGEERGEPAMTLNEYFATKAEEYLTEMVDIDGQVPERGSYRRADRTRLVHLVDKHLQYVIAKAGKDLLQAADERIIEAMKDAMTKQMSQIAANLKVNVSTQ